MQTTVKFDSSIEFPPIVDPLVSPTTEEVPGLAAVDSDKQTKITGIISPLIKLNRTTIEWSSVVSMSLTDRYFPKISLKINDSLGLQRMYDTPGADNRLQLQILPAFDNAYKKINLMFTITDIYFSDGNVYVEGSYNVPGWNNNFMKSFGYSSTYEFFEAVAHLLRMGFCSNIDSTEDKRWIYMANENVSSALLRETAFGGNKYQLLGCWIDYWNNINLVDLYERYNTVDEDIKVWVQNNKLPNIDEDSNNTPQEIEAMISNHPNMRMNPLYSDEYNIVSNFKGNVESGTDKVCEVYNMNTLDTDSSLVMDGNVKKSVVVKYNYLGEEFGDVDYLTNSVMRSSYLQKINSRQIEVKLHTPCLGLMKGGKVNLYIYEVNDFVKGEMLKKKDRRSNIPLPENTDDDWLDEYIINTELSGQYYILECDYNYSNGGNLPTWEQILLLSRKADDIEKLVSDEDLPTDASTFDEDAPVAETEKAQFDSENSDVEKLANGILDNMLEKITIPGTDKLEQAGDFISQAKEILDKLVKD